MSELEALLAKLPLSYRLKLRARWAIRSVVARLPGYAAFMRMQYRFERQGFSGLWEPPFSPNGIPFNRVPARLPWHRWGVLADGEGFRAYTPTARTVEVFSKPNPARFALKDRYYWGSRSEHQWEPLPEQPRAPLDASLKSREEP